MEEHTQYFIVDGNMLPEIYLKVAQAKELLERGEVRTIHQAVCQIGISRSAFYKYKDAIRPFQDMTQGRIINFQIRLKNEPGVLSLILNNFAKWGANILTINQSIPEGRTAIVHIGAETSRLGITLIISRICLYTKSPPKGGLFSILGQKEDSPMSKDKYYELLKAAHEHTDWHDRDSIHAYNEYAHELRKQMAEEDR